MSWSSNPDDLDVAAPDVLEAFRAGRGAGRSTVECYRDAVAAWRRHHPEQAPEYSAKRAVALVLAHHVELKVQE
ncbi:MAG TPA: hypothetical protein VLV50_06280 [Stellaceae bacterium]|nr:hypothetical protein [Stellaceae bacterium]